MQRTNDKFFEEHMENYNHENSAVHRKLQSKIEALKIMRNELEKYRTERDQFKLMAETLQIRYSAIKSSINNFDRSNLDYSNGSSVSILLNETKEKNYALNTEVEALKQKLNELQGDIEVLRKRSSKSTDTRLNHNFNTEELDKSNSEWSLEKSKYIAQMETLKKKNAQLQYDFRSLLDEKEEIVTERDAFKCKSHRLNHELNTVLKGDSAKTKLLDIDALVLENKFLQEKIGNLENELELSKQSTSKYKAMLDTKRKKGIIKLGTNTNSDMFMSHKQVKSLLEQGTISELPLKEATIADLKSLCLALLDNLNDKSLALSHQRKTNKLLAIKMADLEQKLKQFCDYDPKVDSSPSQILLNGYSSSTVDQDLMKIGQKLSVNADEGFVACGSGSSDYSNQKPISTDESTKSVLSSSDYDFDDTYSNGTLNNDMDRNNSRKKSDLEELPPEIAKLVQQSLDAYDSEQSFNSK